MKSIINSKIILAIFNILFIIICFLFANVKSRLLAIFIFSLIFLVPIILFCYIIYKHKFNYISIKEILLAILLDIITIPIAIAISGFIIINIYHDMTIVTNFIPYLNAFLQVCLTLLFVIYNFVIWFITLE